MPTATRAPCCCLCEPTWRMLPSPWKWWWGTRVRECLQPTWCFQLAARLQQTIMTESLLARCGKAGQARRGGKAACLIRTRSLPVLPELLQRRLGWWEGPNCSMPKLQLLSNSGCCAQVSVPSSRSRLLPRTRQLQLLRWIFSYITCAIGFRRGLWAQRTSCATA